MGELQDRFGRRFSYLRLSVTDACNFKCVYCLPEGYLKSEGSENYLSVREIKNLGIAMSELGTWKIRLTGGEPTVRRDLTEIAENLSMIAGIRKVTLSTNGYCLKRKAREFYSAGISGLNISVDSLDPIRFHQITGQDRLKEILSGIEEALKIGFDPVKINAVLMQGWNDSELDGFMEWVRQRPVTVRFIELMSTHGNQRTFQDRHVSSQGIFRELIAKGWLPNSRREADGPAVELSHPGYLGKLGLIAPYSSDFCSTCNRLRVTSQGGLKLCLFGEQDHSLRHFLQEPSQKDDLMNYVTSILQRKEISHDLAKGRMGNNKTFSAMGG